MILNAENILVSSLINIQAMRKFILSFLVLTTIATNAQKLEFGLSVGTGKTYIIEDLDKSIEVEYYLPVSFASDLKFTPFNSKWGIKLRLNYIESAVEGINLPPNMAEPFDGYVSTWTTFLLLENEILKDYSSYGFNFGLGFTDEILEIDVKDPWNYYRNKFPTLALGGHYTFKLNDNFDIQILPIFLVQDPYRLIDYLGGIVDPTIAREDLSILINFGIRYNILKKFQKPK
jgi:hypothetical protein